MHPAQECHNEDNSELGWGMTEPLALTDLADQALMEQARGGSERAFAELWRRHYTAGIRVARQFTTLDADDVVSEAFTRIFAAARSGGGPTGPFRPYLYVTIRNLASTWGAASHDITVDDISAFEDPTAFADPAADALDRTLTARAFRSLPERWQTVLWYTEVEGMDPHEVAPILGMSANSVAALSYRAREGLRKAWLQAHVSDATASGECRWVLSKLADHARHSLGARDEDRITFHLATCAKCAIISDEVDEVGSRLASVLMPILLGGAAGGTLLASLNSSSGAIAVDIPPLPDLAALGAGVAGVTGVAGAAGLAGVLSAPVAVIGSMALAFALAGTAVIAVGPQLTPVVTASSPPDARGDASGDVSGPPVTDAPGPDSPVAIPGFGDGVGDSPGTGEGGVDSGAGGGIDDLLDEADELTDSVVDTITGGEPPAGHSAPGGVAGIDLQLIGTATPGASLSLQASGQVYATTTVGADGTFTLSATAIPGGLSALELVQHVDRSYLATLLPGGGVLEKVLGTLDGLVNALIKPITLSAGGSEISVVLVS